MRSRRRCGYARYREDVAADLHDSYVAASEDHLADPPVISPAVEEGISSHHAIADACRDLAVSLQDVRPTRLTLGEIGLIDEALSLVYDDALPGRAAIARPWRCESMMLTLSISDAMIVSMRTTVRLDPEVAAAAEQLRRERHIGLGEAVNELARAGLAPREKAMPFRQRTASVGLRVDVTNVAETLELLDQYDAEDGR